MASIGEQEGRDLFDRAPFQQLHAGIFPFEQVHNADNNCSNAGPLVALSGRKYRALVQTDPAQASTSRVSLGDGVGSDQTQYAAGAQQMEATTEEVGHQIGIAVTLGMELLKPIEDAVGASFSDGVAGEGWIAYEDIETRIRSTKNIRESKLPVQRLKIFPALSSSRGSPRTSSRASAVLF